jgi:magnesium chelatase subunit D
VPAAPVASTPGALTTPRRRDALERAAIGHHAKSLVTRRTGKYARHRLGASHDIAVDATLRAAAARAGARHDLVAAPVAAASPPSSSDSGRRLVVVPEDLRRKVREHRSPLAVVFVVDNSYSLAAAAMAERVKGMAAALLADAANHGDRLAVVAFGGFADATVVLPFTRSSRRARERLERLPVSGRTPLPDALVRAHRLLRQERIKHPNAVPWVVVITDGRGTVPLRPGGDPHADAVDQARRLARARIGCLVADASTDGSPEARELAAAARGRCVRLDDLGAELIA